LRTDGLKKDISNGMPKDLGTEEAYLYLGKAEARHTEEKSGRSRATQPALDLKGRVPELDGIRGIAIALVLVYHYFLRIPATPGTLPAYLLATGRLTWSGVDLFFVLSGFLIGGILLDARESASYFKVFYTRRFLRIVPIYFAVLAGAFGVSWLVRWGAAGKLAFMGVDQLPWVTYLVFLQNFWMVATSTYGGWGLGQTWSLAVEEQFYLTLPSVVRFFSPRALVGILIGGVVAAPALRTLFHVLWPTHVDAGVLLMPCRADALLLGVLGAIALRNPRWRAKVEKNRRSMLGALVVLAGGFGVLTVAAPVPGSFGMLSFGLTWLAVFYLCILLYALLNRESWMSRLLRWRWLAWLGSIAYGVYLLHEPVRYVLYGLIWSGPHPVVSPLKEIAVATLALAITLAICRASWIFFEKPLIKLGHRVDYEGGDKPEEKVKNKAKQKIENETEPKPISRAAATD
jgi:peptidoglycan/LPS O-acetylase OafA/YrhL